MGMFISEIITYGIYFDFWTTKYDEASIISKGLPTAFMSHLSYSMFLSFTALIILNKISSNKKRFNLLIIVYFAFIFGNLIISGGRTGLFTFVVTIILFSIFYSKHKIRSINNTSRIY